MMYRISLFFLQAEDGIRDLYVTGVQTCALPIWMALVGYCREWRLPSGRRFSSSPSRRPATGLLVNQIGRASCRERVYISVGAACLKKKIWNQFERSILLIEY